MTRRLWGGFWNIVEGLAAQHATVWPSQHAVHKELTGQLREVCDAARELVEHAEYNLNDGTYHVSGDDLRRLEECVE